jgi:ABC-type uncharacterized transport system fused permease/ATPase subunit
MRVQAIDYVRDTIGEDIRAVCSDKSSTGNGLVNHSPDLSVTISILWNKIYSKASLSWTCDGIRMLISMWRVQCRGMNFPCK